MWKIYDLMLQQRLILGTARYPSLQVMTDAINASQTEMVTVSLKRELGGGVKNSFWQTLKKLNCQILPNTAGCRSANEAVTVAEMAREIFSTHYIKLEVIGDDYTLQPDVIELVKASEILISKGFSVFPYCNDDPVVAKQLVNLGCEVLMPLASPIGSGQGIRNPKGLQLLRQRFPQIKLIVDAGIGTPSDANQVMEMGYDGVILNSAVAMADQPEKMARAFALAVQSGRLAYEAKRMPVRDFAVNSTPLTDTLFWHQESVDDNA